MTCLNLEGKDIDHLILFTLGMLYIYFKRLFLEFKLLFFWKKKISTDNIIFVPRKKYRGQLSQYTENGKMLCHKNVSTILLELKFFEIIFSRPQTSVSLHSKNITKSCQFWPSRSSSDCTFFGFFSTWWAGVTQKT